MSKPVVSFIAGRAPRPGVKMGHAGAIVLGTVGSYDGNRPALVAAGANVADTPTEIQGLLEAGPGGPPPNRQPWHSRPESQTEDLASKVPRACQPAALSTLKCQQFRRRRSS